MVSVLTVQEMIIRIIITLMITVLTVQEMIIRIIITLMITLSRRRLRGSQLEEEEVLPP